LARQRRAQRTRSKSVARLVRRWLSPRGLTESSVSGGRSRAIIPAARLLQSDLFGARRLEDILNRAQAASRKHRRATSRVSLRRQTCASPTDQLTSGEVLGCRTGGLRLILRGNAGYHPSPKGGSRSRDRGVPPESHCSEDPNAQRQRVPRLKPARVDLTFTDGRQVTRLEKAHAATSRSLSRRRIGEVPRAARVVLSPRRASLRVEELVDRLELSCPRTLRSRRRAHALSPCQDFGGGFAQDSGRSREDERDREQEFRARQYDGAGPRPGRSHRPTRGPGDKGGAIPRFAIGDHGRAERGGDPSGERFLKNSTSPRPRAEPGYETLPRPSRPVSSSCPHHRGSEEATRRAQTRRAEDHDREKHGGLLAKSSMKKL